MRISALALALALVSSVEPVTAQEATFNRVEYWECPSENSESLVVAMDSIWGPIFDEMTKEGHFRSWLWERPVAAREFEFVGEQESTREISPPWQFVVVTTAESREEMDAAWDEFVDRLQSRYPDDPRPTRFCGHLLIVDYERGAGS